MTRIVSPADVVTISVPLDHTIYESDVDEDSDISLCSQPSVDQEIDDVDTCVTGSIDGHVARHVALLKDAPKVGLGPPW